MNKLIEMFENTDGQKLTYQLDGSGYNIMLLGEHGRYHGMGFHNLIYNYRSKRLGVFNEFWHEYNKMNHNNNRDFILYIEDEFNIKILEVV